MPDFFYQEGTNVAHTDQNSSCSGQLKTVAVEEHLTWKALVR